MLLRRFMIDPSIQLELQIAKSLIKHNILFLLKKEKNFFHRNLSKC